MDFEDFGFEDISTGFTNDQEINTGSLEVHTGSGPVSTPSTKVSIPSPDKGQREGKAPMIIEETQAPKKTREQILQEEASLAKAIRLDTLEKEETTKQIHLDALLAQRIAEEEGLTEQQKQRRAQVQFEAQHYTEEDWDVIRAKLEANAELSKSVLGKDLAEEDFAKKMVDGVDKVYISFEAMLKDISRDDLTELYKIFMKKYGMIGPEDEYEKVLWEYMKNMFDAPLKSTDIYMLIERNYPLSAEVCKAILDKKLQGGIKNEDCYKLLKLMEKQADCTKALATPEQTATGKEISNSLTTDSLLKTIRSSMYLVIAMKH
ncbi:hypothetical protein Tco_1493426 [Tanacetum coccineum]